MNGSTALGLKIRIGRFYARVWKYGWEYSNGCRGRVFFFPWKPTKKVTVGSPYRLSCVSDDRWGRPYKHPYTVEGFSKGKLDANFWSKLDRFQNFELSKEAKEELHSNLAVANGLTLASDKTKDILALATRISPRAVKEIQEVMADAKSLVWQINVEVGEGEYVRSFVIFSNPEAGGLKRINPTVQELRRKALTLVARFLNLIGAWSWQDLPTHEELGY